MRTKLTASLRRVLRAEAHPHHEVHFHTDTDGRAFVCDVHRCESPRLLTSELGLAR